jgi:hypothetical protein
MSYKHQILVALNALFLAGFFSAGTTAFWPSCFDLIGAFFFGYASPSYKPHNRGYFIIGTLALLGFRAMGWGLFQLITF